MASFCFTYTRFWWTRRMRFHLRCHHPPKTCRCGGWKVVFPFWVFILPSSGNYKFVNTPLSSKNFRPTPFRVTVWSERYLHWSSRSNLITFPKEQLAKKVRILNYDSDCYPKNTTLSSSQNSEPHCIRNGYYMIEFIYLNNFYMQPYLDFDTLLEYYLTSKPKFKF